MILRFDEVILTKAQKTTVDEIMQDLKQNYVHISLFRETDEAHTNLIVQNSNLIKDV